MEYLYIGKIVNTHGIKGEIKLLSDFECKEEVFKNGINIYIGTSHIKEVINTYRHHKIFDMLTLDNITNINEVLKYKNEKVYVNKEEIDFSNKTLKTDLINMEVYMDKKLIGKATEVRKNPGNDLLVVNETILIPYIDKFITVNDKNIEIINMEGLIWK